MKKLLTLLTALLALGIALAQEVTPPKFQGADIQRFMTRLAGEAEKIAVQQQIPAGELSPEVFIGLTVDAEGAVMDCRWLDNTAEGRDYRDAAPASERTKQLLTEALGGLEKWTPAERNGVPEAYPMTLKLRLPIAKIAKAQEADPLLFLGGDPAQTFHAWAQVRLRFDERFTGKGVEGVIRVKFYVEPDGKITIGDIEQSSDDKLAQEVIRVIKKSKGFWTPRAVRGVPQRASYVYGVNFHND